MTLLFSWCAEFRGEFGEEVRTKESEFFTALHNYSLYWQNMGKGEETIAVHEKQKSCGRLFYSTWFCPYAQRAWIALEFKQVPYEWRECILYEGSPSAKLILSLEEKSKRTPGFIECSPRGLVPAVQMPDFFVNDSLPVIEFFEDSILAHPLLPSSASERAKIRMGIALWNELVVGKFYSLLLSPSEDWEAGKTKLYAGLDAVMAMFTSEGPFFSSFGFSLFECACLPWMQRTLVTLPTYRNFTLCPKKYSRLHEWYAAALKVPAFANTVVDESRLIESYAGYASNAADTNAADLYRVAKKKPST